jgi:hypothetical protein
MPPKRRLLLRTVLAVGVCCLLGALAVLGGWRPGSQDSPEAPPGGDEELPAPPAPRKKRQPFVDLTPRPLGHIPAGTVIGDGPPPGWSDLVLFATPTLRPEDVSALPKLATYYASLFKYVWLANVVKQKAGGAGAHRLKAFAWGFAVDVEGEPTIVSSRNPGRSKLSFLGRRILAENERIQDSDVRQVARADTLMVFDAKARMRRGEDHVPMVNRHALVVDPATGKLSTLVWLLSKEEDGSYALAEEAMQLLPPGMREVRMLSVKRDRFVLGVPTADAFALVRIPQGKPIRYTPGLKELAAVKDFTRAQVLALEKALRAELRKAR